MASFGEADGGEPGTPASEAAARDLADARDTLSAALEEAKRQIAELQVREAEHRRDGAQRERRTREAEEAASAAAREREILERDMAQMDARLKRAANELARAHFRTDTTSSALRNTRLECAALHRTKAQLEDDMLRAEQQSVRMRDELRRTEAEARARRARQLKLELDRCQRDCWDDRRAAEAQERDSRKVLWDRKRGEQFDAVRREAERLRGVRKPAYTPQLVGTFEVYVSVEDSCVACAVEMPWACTWKDLRRRINTNPILAGLNDGYTFAGLPGSRSGATCERTPLKLPFVPLRTDGAVITQRLMHIFALPRIRTYQDDNYEQWRRRGQQQKPYGFTLPWVQLRRPQSRRWSSVSQAFHDPQDEPTQALRHAGDFWANETDLCGTGYLHMAVPYGSEKVVRALVNAGCWLLLRDGQGRTAAHLAAARGAENLLFPMLKEKATVRSLLDSVDFQGRTLLHTAAAHDQTTIVRILIERGADISRRDSWQRTPLAWAVASGSEGAVQALLAAGAPVEATGAEGDIFFFRRHKCTEKRGRTALWCWSIEPVAEILASLRDSTAAMLTPVLAAGGADFGASFSCLTQRQPRGDDDGAPSLYSLSRRPHLHSAGGLVGEPQDELLVGSRCAMVAAVATRKAGLLVALLEAGADPDVWADQWAGSVDAIDRECARPTHLIELAAAQGWDEGLSILAEACPDLIARREPPCPQRPETVLVLHAALRSGDTSTVSAALLLPDAFVGWAPGGGAFAQPAGSPPVPHNALASAIAAGDLEAVEALLETEPQLAGEPCVAVAMHSRAALAATPLWYAAFAGLSEIVAFLVTHTSALDDAGSALPGLFLITPREDDRMTDFTDGLTCTDACPFTTSPGCQRRAAGSCIGAGLAPGSDLLPFPSPLGRRGGWAVHNGRVECMRTLVTAARHDPSGRPALDFFSCGFARGEVQDGRPLPKPGKARARVWGGPRGAARPRGLYNLAHLAVLSGSSDLASLVAASMSTPGPSSLSFSSDVDLPTLHSPAPLQGWRRVYPEESGALLRLWAHRLSWGSQRGGGWAAVLSRPYVSWLSESEPEAVSVAVTCCRRGLTSALRLLAERMQAVGAGELAAQALQACLPHCLAGGRDAGALLGVVLPRLGPAAAAAAAQDPAVLEGLARWGSEAGFEGTTQLLEKLSEETACGRSLHGGAETLATASARWGSPTLRVVTTKWPASVHRLNAAGQQPLHLSCAFGHVGDALFLLRQGADVMGKDRIPARMRGCPSAQEGDSIVEAPCGRARREALYRCGFYPKAFDLGVRSLCVAAAAAHRAARKRWREHVEIGGFGPLQYLTRLSSRRLQECVAGRNGVAGGVLINGLFVHNQHAFPAAVCGSLLMAPRSARGAGLPDWDPKPELDVDDVAADPDGHGIGAPRLPDQWLSPIAMLTLPIELATLTKEQREAPPEARGAAPSEGPDDPSNAPSVLPGQRGLAAYYAGLVAKPKRSLLRLLSRYGASLDELDFGGECPGAVTLRVLSSELLERLPRLRKLGLRSCQVTNASVAQLAKAVEKHPSMEQLDLSLNPDIYLEGGSTLQRLLQKNPRITNVDLTGTGLSPATCRVIDALCEANVKRTHPQQP